MTMSARRTEPTQSLPVRESRASTEWGCSPGMHRAGWLVNAIDHITVPNSARVLATSQADAEGQHGTRLSDHDPYTTEIALT